MIKMRRYGIFEITSSNDEHVSIYKTKEERDYIWNGYTEHYRKKRQFKKVVVEIKEEVD